MSAKKKICLITPSLERGGMERVLTLIANYSAKKGYSVFIICLITGDNIAYCVEKSVEVYAPNYNYRKGIFNKFKTFNFLIRTLRSIKPDTILCFSEIFNPLAILSAKILKFSIYISDRSNPNKKLPFVSKFLRKALYPRANGMISQTELAREIALDNRLNSNIHVIPNPLRGIDDTIPKKYGKQIISVGRLVNSKNFHELIEIFCSLKNSNGWKLVILGEGSERGALDAQIRKMNVGHKVILAGAVEDVDTYLSEASIFAFTSLSEGFPNALSEGMAFPLACIAYDCPAGPSDIILHNKNGFLIEVGDKVGYRALLQKLVDNEKGIRESFISEAIKNRERYSSEVIIEDYLDFILSSNVGK